jgi:hypothetical protein
MKMDDGRPIVVPIEIETITRDIGNSNTIRSIHPKDDPARILDWALNKGLLIAWDKKKGRVFLENSAPANWEQYSKKIDLLNKSTPKSPQSQGGLINFAPAILPTEEEIKALPKLIKKSSSEANQLVADKKAWEASGHSREQAEAIISKYYQPEAFADIPARIAKALGTPEKPVILKPNILQKNLAAHPDLTPEMSAQILQETINRPTQIIQGKPTSKPNYWVFIKKDSPNKISVLEVSEAKEGIEIVGWRMGNDKAVARIEKERPEGGRSSPHRGGFLPNRS